MKIRCALAVAAIGIAGQVGRDAGWQSTFDVDLRQLVATGASRYFVLDPGHELVLEDGDERLFITVLGETRDVGGVITRVVEERETKGGKLVEISRNFFARHPTTGDVYYFGEDVDIYKNGKVVNHEGAWVAGRQGAKFGLFLPGSPVQGARFYQEIAPKVALDRVRVLTTAARVSTPAGTFDGCLRIEETTPLEPRVKDYKVFAPGIGIVQDGSLKLIRHGRR